MDSSPVESRDKPSKWIEALFASGAVVFLAVAWAYTAGWSYAYTYFDRFNLGLLGMEIPRDHLLVYGFQVIWNLKWQVPGWLLAIVTRLYFLNHAHRPYRDSKIWSAYVLVGF